MCQSMVTSWLAHIKMKCIFFMLPNREDQIQNWSTTSMEQCTKQAYKPQQNDKNHELKKVDKFQSFQEKFLSMELQRYHYIQGTSKKQLHPWNHKEISTPIEPQRNSCIFFNLFIQKWITASFSIQNLADQGNVAQHNESSTYLMGWLRDYLWMNSSQLINGYNPFSMSSLTV